MFLSQSGIEVNRDPVEKKQIVEVFGTDDIIPQRDQKESFANPPGSVSIFSLFFFARQPVGPSESCKAGLLCLDASECSGAVAIVQQRAYINTDIYIYIYM